MMPDPLLAQAGATASLITFGIYSLAVFGLAWFAHKLLQKRAFVGEYYLGSRGLGVIAFTLTFGATVASAGSFAGFPALIYTHGWILIVWISGYTIFGLVSAGLVGKRLNHIARKSNAITLPDVLRARFDSPAVGLLATGFIIAFLALYLIPQFKIASIILQQLFEGSPLYERGTVMMDHLRSALPWMEGVDAGYLLCLVIFAVLVIVYSTFGGFRAVVWTDVLQGMVMLAGVLLMLGLALWQTGGLESATQKMGRMTTPNIAKVTFRLAQPAGEDYRIASDQWFVVEDWNRFGLLRLNGAAVIRKGETESSEVKAAQITTPETIAEVLGSFPSGTPPPLLDVPTEPVIKEIKTYAYGSGTTGVYVSGPGPSLTKVLGFLTAGGAISFFLLFALSGAGQPGNLVRLMAFDSTRTLRRSIALLSVYFLLIYVPLIIIFCCARVLVPGMDAEPDRIMPVTAFTLCDNAGIPWLAGLLVAAPFAAAMSTVDSFLLMVSSSVVRDVYQTHINPKATERKIKLLSYATMLFVGIVVTIGAIKPPRLLQDLIVFVGGGLGVAFLVPVALAVYWKRFNTPGIIASMLGGMLIYTSLYVVGYTLTGEIRSYALLGIDAILWGFAGSLLFGIAVSVQTKPPDQKLLRKFF